MSNLTEIIQNKSLELTPIMYSNLTPVEVNTLWDNFETANPELRANYTVYIESLKTAKPEATEANALSIINAGVAWLIDTANSLPAAPPAGPPDH